MQLKESTALITTLFILILLSQTTFRIGKKKFAQVVCTAHLTQLYSSLIAELEENPLIFAQNPEKPWHALLSKTVRQSYFTCPATQKHVSDHGSSKIHYAMNQRVYNILKAGKPLPDTGENTILFIDSAIDPIGFQLFPLTNPAFRHNGGCNILHTNGTVQWVEKELFGENTVY